MYNPKCYINKRYIGGKVIGYGSYSKVKKATDTNNDDTVALKIVYLNRIKQNALYALGGQNTNCKVENEIRILSSLDHQNIIHVYQSEWNNEKKKFYIAMELCKCNLEDLIESVRLENKNIGLDLIHLQIFFGQMLRSIEYIHDHHIVHHDIKPSNFLLGYDCNLKLIDFGSAMELNSENENSLPYDSTGTPMFQAPELVLLEPISEKMSRYALDIWAAGVTLYYLSCGHYPFQGENIFELFRNIREYYTGDITIEYHDIPNYPPLLDLIQKMLKPNHQRPTAKEILEHQFLKNSLPMEMLDKRIYEIIETRFKGSSQW